jgi:hypothetical protein
VTTEQDRRYVRAEGVTLVSRMWGEEGEEDPAAAKARRASSSGRDAFALLWDGAARVWVAVYRMCVDVGACRDRAFGRRCSSFIFFVVFLSFAVRDPLLCLTASITVRERPVSVTPARAVLAAMLKEAGGLPESQPSAPTQSFNDETEKSYHGLDEVNLLWGLSSGTRIFSLCVRCTQQV